MLKDLVDVYNNMKKNCENPERLILDGYVPKNGTYVLVEVDREKNNFEIQEPVEINNTKKNDEEDVVIRDYDYIKFLDYNSSLISMNKPIDSKKKIHSNNYLTLFFKKETITTDDEKKKLDDDVIVGYYALLKDIEKKYTNKKAKESYESAAKDLEEIDLELLEKIENWVLKNKFWENEKYNLKDKNYFKIFFVLKDDEKRTKELYENEGKRYLLPNIYNKNDYNVKIEDEVIGLSGNNMGMNSKKPFLENKTRKTKVPILITQEEALNYSELFKLISNMLSEKKYNIYIDYDRNTIKGYRNGEIPDQEIKSGAYIMAQIGQNEPEIQHFDTISNFGDKTCKSFQYNQVIKTNLEDDKYEYITYERYSSIQRLINGVIFENKLIENYFRGSSDIKVKNLKIKEELLMTRDIYLNWFYKGVTNGICNTLDKSILKIIKSNILEGKIIAAKKQMNLRYSLISYFTNNKKEEELMEEIREYLIEKILLEKEEQDNWDIENDDVYSYLVGQIVSGLLSFSKAKTVPASSINQFLNTDNDKIIKNKLIRLYEKYNYSIDARYYNRMSSVLGKVLRYEVKNIINKNLLLAGFLDSKIFFMKKEENK